MTTPHRSFPWFTALFVLGSAQVPAQDLGVPSTALRVTRDGTGAHAVGPDYAARFDARGVEFTPAPAAAAERPSPVRFTLDAVRRGASDVFVRTADVEPGVHGQQVRYAHRADLIEVYDVRADGIEQSFVFATQPRSCSSPLPPTMVCATNARARAASRSAP